MAESQSAARHAAYFEALSPSLAALKQTYATGNAPHALMLSGQFGVGKKTLAMLLAKALLCEDPVKPCSQCAGCRKTQDLTHENLLLVRTLDKQRTVKVEQSRALLASLATYPFSTGPRVVILSQVDVFTPQAQNALLKAIEEPDAATFFFLTCENEDAVLTTIRSRCQIQRVPPWPEALMQRLLLEQGIQEPEARRLAAQAGGSPGKALAIRGDDAFWNLKDIADAHVLSLKHPGQLPAASSALRGLRDRAEELLHYLENAATRLTKTTDFDDNTAIQARSLLEGVLTARKHQASNLSWQAVVDQLLIKLLEDQALCKQ